MLIVLILVQFYDVNCNIFSPQDPAVPLFRYSLGLDSSLQLSWDISPPTETIRFHLEAEVGQDDLLVFGFSSYGEAHGADVVVIWSDHKGMRHFQVRLCCVVQVVMEMDKLFMINSKSLVNLKAIGVCYFHYKHNIDYYTVCLAMNPLATDNLGEINCFITGLYVIRLS